MLVAIAVATECHAADRAEHHVMSAPDDMTPTLSYAQPSIGVIA